MKSKVMLVELTGTKNIFPLVSGYLQAYACKDQLIEEIYSFHKYLTHIDTPYSCILQDLQKSDSSIYGFSCYCWNMGLVKSLVIELLKSKPHLHIILGGPQIAYQGHKHLNPEHKNLVICNGEGEITFYNYLKELANKNPSFHNVRGLNFYNEKELVLTEDEDLIQNLDEIPSPFLNNLFEENKYTTVNIETTRGCPYKCAYCYWGGQTHKIRKFSEERIYKEITWLSKHRVIHFGACDANWGILKRDLEFVKHVVKCNNLYGFPLNFFYTGSPNRASAIEMDEMIYKAGLFTSRPFSLQSLSNKVLSNIDRVKSINMEIEDYAVLQRKYNEKKLSSLIDLIWPLPGETLSSFMDGVDKLCERWANVIYVFAFMLLPNTKLAEKKEEFGFETMRKDDERMEIDYVVKTKEVTFKDYQEGLFFYYALFALYNLKSLNCLANYLHNNRICKYSELFTSFKNFSIKNWSQLVQTFLPNNLTYDDFSIANLMHMTLHSQRDDLDVFLSKFVSINNWWNNRDVHALFEIDLLNRPYLYRNTQIKDKKYSFECLKILEVLPDGYIVQVPDEYHSFLKECVEEYKVSNKFKITCINKQMPFMKAKGVDNNYCSYILGKIKSVMPLWTKVE